MGYKIFWKDVMYLFFYVEKLGKTQQFQRKLNINIFKKYLIFSNN